MATKKPPMDKSLSGMGMNQRELVQRNPSTPFAPGLTAPASGGHNSTAPGIAKAKPKTVNYKGRKITAEPDASRATGGGIPMAIKPKVKKFNPKND